MKGFLQIPTRKDTLYDKHRRLWSDFTKSCRIGNKVRPPIASSWQRCFENNLDPRAPNVSKLLGRGELSRLLAARKPLLDASRSSLKILERSLSKIPHTILLSDEDGNIIYASGSRHVWRQFEECGVDLGGSVNEKYVGTTAPGVVLTEKKAAMIVTYAEHYSEIYHWCCCTASPIFKAAGSLAGCLNITTSGDHFENIQLLHALNVSTARYIQLELHTAQFIEGKPEAEDFIGGILANLEHGIIIFDNDGKILHTNQRACHLLKTPMQHLLCKHHGQVIKTDALGICFSRDANVRGKATLLHGSEKREECMLEAKPLHDQNGQKIGLMAVLEEGKKLWPTRKEGASFVPFIISDVLGESAGMRRAIELARRFAPSDVPVLIYGETGTGKDVFAQVIHNLSNREGGPFVPLNCAAIPSGLVESELFGYVKGAFTGALPEGKKGKFEIASGGTLFFDEIDSMPLELQAKLLRALETGEILSLGDHSCKSVDVRIIAAMGHNPESNRVDSRLRKDLFYRISSVRIFLPPLRDRSEDLELLAYAFLRHFCTKRYKWIHRIEPDVVSILKSHDWPGNVRELKSAIEFAVFASDSDTIRVEHLPDYVTDNVAAKRGSEKKSVTALKEMEKTMIQRILEENGGSRGHAAQAMGLSRTTFYRKCKKHGLVERPHRNLLLHHSPNQ